MPACCFGNTRFGDVAVLWSVDRGRPSIRRILLSSPQVSARQAAAAEFPDCKEDSRPEIDALIGRINAFLGGADIIFSLDLIRLDLCSPFQERVLRAEYAIPRGKVSTYNLIARHLNNPRGARAVGTALATNPFPLIIPCHRAIRSDGTLGGYQGGLKMKKALLEMEGVAFNEKGWVKNGGFFYQNG